MPNPIYILHLSDWHLTYRNRNNVELENNIDNLKENIKFFLEQRGREFLDIMTITGDMMDKNGLPLDEKNKIIPNIPQDHSVAIDLIKSLGYDEDEDEDEKESEAIYKVGKTRVYCCPGNHDTNFEDTLSFLNENDFCSNGILKKNDIPNYEIVDLYHKKLKNSFFHFEKFAKEIKATNKDNPLFGYDKIKYEGDVEIFISWFNSSWLSIKRWSEIKSNPRIYPVDYENITAGNKVNQDVYNHFENYLNDKSKKAKFSLSLFHHFPRLLSWHDKNSNISPKKIEFDKKSTDVLIACQTYPNFINSNSHYIYDENICFYDRVKKNNLVLNGHTHGKLHDHPFYTTSSNFTNELGNLKKAASLFEVDLHRGTYVIHEIPIENKLHSNYQIEELNKRTQIYDDEYYYSKMRSDYSKTDYLHDAIYNGRIKKLSNYSNKLTLVDLNNFKNFNNSKCNELLNKLSFSKNDIQNTPMIEKYIKIELEGLVEKHNI